MITFALFALALLLIWLFTRKKNQSNTTTNTPSASPADGVSKNTFSLSSLNMKGTGDFLSKTLSFWGLLLALGFLFLFLFNPTVNDFFLNFDWSLTPIGLWLDEKFGQGTSDWLRLAVPAIVVITFMAFMARKQLTGVLKIIPTLMLLGLTAWIFATLIHTFQNSETGGVECNKTADFLLYPEGPLQKGETLTMAMCGIVEFEMIPGVGREAVFYITQESLERHPGLAKGINSFQEEPHFLPISPNGKRFRFNFFEVSGHKPVYVAITTMPVQTQ